MISVLTTLGFLALLPSQSPAPHYDFPVNSETKFNVKVQFDGFIPLFGGRNGKADVSLVVKAASVLSQRADLQAVDSEIIELNAVAFGSALPLNKNNIGQFYPKATATFDRLGKVNFNSAPEVNMPVKLPGLDSKRLPEISYIPLILNSEAIMANKSYQFERTFNGAPLKYTVTPNTKNDHFITFDIAVTQQSSGFEDAYGNPAIEEGAKSKLATNLTGTGTATFNLDKNMFDKVVVETKAETDVTVIKTGKSSKRNLKTTLTIVRDGAKVDQ